VDISKRSIESIVRHWIILPECSVQYAEDAKPAVKIGFSSVADAVQHFSEIERGSSSAEGRPEIIVKTLSESTEVEGIPINAQYELGFVVRQGFHPERFFVRTPGRPIPAVCIEGIRVSDSLPGFREEETRRPLALLSVRGSRKFRTTVSRAGLEEDDEFDRVGEMCARLLFQHVHDEVIRIVALPGNPLSQASSASRWLRNQLYRAALPEIRSYLWSLHNEIPSVVIETVDDTRSCLRSMISNNDADMLLQFWTLEARLLDLLGTISRDLGREVSLNEFLSKLAPELEHFRFSPLMPDAEVFSFSFGTSHHPELVEISRQHQYSAVRWLRGSDDPSQLCLSLEFLKPDYLEVVEQIYRQKDDDLTGYASRLKRIDMYAARIRGDAAEKVEAVATALGIILLPGSFAHGFWLNLRERIVTLGQTGEAPDRMADLYLVAAALNHWLLPGGDYSASKAKGRWSRVWAAVSDDVRRSIDIPRNADEVIERSTIFSARTYWRDWGKLTEE
jgi:hypothetical protein